MPFKKGFIPWNKNPKEVICVTCNKTFLVKQSKKSKYCSRICMGKGLSIRYKGRNHPYGDKISKKLKGKPKSEEHKAKMPKFPNGHIPWNKGIKRTDIVGEKNGRWKGGVTKEQNQKRKTYDYRVWRKGVFKRDNYTCVITGKKSNGDISAHHIKNFENHIDLRFNEDNGITMNQEVHKEFHRMYGQKNNNIEQIYEFLFYKIVIEPTVEPTMSMI